MIWTMEGKGLSWYCVFLGSTWIASLMDKAVYVFCCVCMLRLLVEGFKLRYFC